MSWYSPMPPHPYTSRHSSLWPRLVDMTATAAVVSPQNGRRHRPEISQSFFRLSPLDGEGDQVETAPGKTLLWKALSHHFRASMPNPDTQLPVVWRPPTKPLEISLSSVGWKGQNSYGNFLLCSLRG